MSHDDPNKIIDDAPVLMALFDAALTFAREPLNLPAPADVMRLHLEVFAPHLLLREQTIL